MGLAGPGGAGVRTGCGQEHRWRPVGRTRGILGGCLGLHVPGADVRRSAAEPDQDGGKGPPARVSPGPLRRRWHGPGRVRRSPASTERKGTTIQGMMACPEKTLRVRGVSVVFRPVQAISGRWTVRTWNWPPACPHPVASPMHPNGLQNAFAVNPFRKSGSTALSWSLAKNMVDSSKTVPYTQRASLANLRNPPVGRSAPGSRNPESPNGRGAGPRRSAPACQGAPRHSVNPPRADNVM